jgi:EAL domain-containing protein (putative c-di-GMP-specific phosphodiesterase class I)
VDNEEQVQFLKSHLCGVVQGFLYSKSVDANEITKLFQTGTPFKSE